MWGLLGAHAITYSTLFMILMFIFFQSQLFPGIFPFIPNFVLVYFLIILEVETSFILSALFWVFNKFMEGTFITGLGLVLWSVLWILDYCTNISLEWIPFTLLTVFSIVGWPYFMTLLFISLTLLVYWYLPLAFSSVLANLSLHIITVVVLRLATVSNLEQPLGQIIKKFQLQDYIVFAVLFYVDFFYRNRPERFALLGVISALWGLFLGGSLALNKLVTYLESVEPKSKNSRPKQQQGSNGNPILDSIPKMNFKSQKGAQSHVKDAVKEARRSKNEEKNRHNIVAETILQFAGVVRIVDL